MSAEHIIEQLRWESYFDAQHKAYELQNYLSHFTRFQLGALCNEIFAELVPAGQIWQIDRVDLDIGEISLQDLPWQLPLRIKARLTEFIAGALTAPNSVRKISITQTASHTSGANERLCELLQYFFTTGLLPWWAPKGINPLQVFDGLVSDNNAILTELLYRQGQKLPIRRRMVKQLNDLRLGKLVQLLEPGNKTLVITYVEDVCALQAKKLLAPVTAGEFKEQIWLSVLTYLLVDRGSLFNTMAFLRSSLFQLAQRFGVEYRQLLANLAAAAQSLHAIGLQPPQFITAILAIDAQDNPAAESISNHLAPGAWNLLTQWLNTGGQGNTPAHSHTACERNLSIRSSEDVLYWLAREDRQRLKQYFDTFGNKSAVQKRMVEHFSAQALSIVVHLIEPGESRFILQHVKNTQGVVSDRPSFNKLVWQIVLAYLFNNEGSYFNRRQFIIWTLQRVANAHNLKLANVLDLVVHRMQAESANVQYVELLRILIALQVRQRNLFAPQQRDLVQPKSLASPSMPRWLHQQLLQLINQSRLEQEPELITAQRLQMFLAVNQWSWVFKLLMPEQANHWIKLCHSFRRALECNPLLGMCCPELFELGLNALYATALIFSRDNLPWCGASVKAQFATQIEQSLMRAGFKQNKAAVEQPQYGSVNRDDACPAELIINPITIPQPVGGGLALHKAIEECFIEPLESAQFRYKRTAAQLGQVSQLLAYYCTSIGNKGLSAEFSDEHQALELSINKIKPADFIAWLSRQPNKYKWIQLVLTAPGRQRKIFINYFAATISYPAQPIQTLLRVLQAEHNSPLPARELAHLLITMYWSLWFGMGAAPIHQVLACLFYRCSLAWWPALSRNKNIHHAARQLTDHPVWARALTDQLVKLPAAINTYLPMQKSRLQRTRSLALIPVVLDLPPYQLVQQAGLVSALRHYLITGRFPSYWLCTGNPDVRFILTALARYAPAKLAKVVRGMANNSVGLKRLVQHLALDELIAGLGEEFNFGAKVLGASKQGRQRCVHSSVLVVNPCYTQRLIKDPTPKLVFVAFSRLYEPIVRAQMHEFLSSLSRINMGRLSTSELEIQLYTLILAKADRAVCSLCQFKTILKEYFWLLISRLQVKVDTLQRAFDVVQLGYSKQLAGAVCSALACYSRSASLPHPPLIDSGAERIPACDYQGGIIPVFNAGLVLVQAFLPLLLARLNCLDGAIFPNLLAQIRAVHITQYLVTGLTGTPEYLLPLNKILCGVAIEEPVNISVEISLPEQEICLSLLHSLLARWPEGGSSSVEGLRGNWLVREGTLTERTDHWDLIVEKRPYDLLLDKSVFSYSIIKLPWMPKPLYVTWPT